MKSSLVTRLASDAAIAALLPTGTDSKKPVSWFGFQRGDSTPQVALSIVSPGEEWTLESNDWLDRPRVRIDLQGSDPDVIETLSVAVKAEMRDSADVAGIRFHPAQLEAERLFDLGEQDGGTLLFQVQLEFIFHHEEI